MPAQKPLEAAALDATRRSWNLATRNHNSHKGDQAAFLRGGGDTVFEEELELLGDLRGKTLAHLQCNSGQDSLCLARRGALVTGVDLSDEAIAFARGLSASSRIPATFVESELLEFLHTTDLRFDLAFSSYGAAGWIEDLQRWGAGIHRVLRPGGRFVYMEFHPALWSIGKDFHLSGDDYFATAPFVEPVSDYVAASQAALGATSAGQSEVNEIPATAWQHTLAQFITALLGAGLQLETLQEYPHTNGYLAYAGMVAAPLPRRWVLPPGVARLPLMFGLSARRDDSPR